MNYEWVFLSLLSAFGQALGWAFKKKSLENAGLNNTLGCVSFFAGGVLLALLQIAVYGPVMPVITPRFIMAASVVIAANVIAAFAAYKALDRAPLSLLMPFFALATLGAVPVEFLVRGVVPHAIQILGMVVLVSGAIILSLKAMPDKAARRALGVFFISILCYSIGIPFQAVAVEEVNSGLFTATVFLIGVALGFFPLVILSNEKRVITRKLKSGEWKKVLWLMFIVGAVTALLEWAPALDALLTAKASEVYALKRTMPFFALILGIVMFKEKVTKRHIAGTALLVIGSMMVVWFR